MSKITISLGDIPVEKTDSDEDLQRKAERHLPTALKKIGEQVGAELWDTMKKTLGSGPLKMDSSLSAKQKFVREKGQEYARNVTLADKQKILKSVLGQLKEIRDRKNE